MDEDFDWKNDANPGTAMEDTLIYRMHVRGFTKDESSGVKNKGTFKGIQEKIPYIKSLGVNIIYLSPIFEAYSNHKYDVGDYSKVDDCFGGEAALELLIQEAKSCLLRKHFSSPKQGT